MYDNIMKLIGVLIVMVMTGINLQAHGSQGYAPDAYYQVTNQPILVTSLSDHSKSKLPTGTVIHLLSFEDGKTAVIQLKDGYLGTMRAGDLFKMDYLGMGLFIQRPF